MAIDSNVELLGDVALFEGLQPDLLFKIASKGQKVFFDAGETLVEAGEKCTKGLLILSGTVETRPLADSVLSPETFEAGTLVGEMAMLTEVEASMDIVARERVRALAIDRNGLYALMDDEPDIAFHLSDRVTERLIDFANDLRSLDVRLAALELSADDTIAVLG